MILIQNIPKASTIRVPLIPVKVATKIAKDIGPWALM